ncbi:putative PRONE domain-containing protein [Helianthus anomalus]
MSSRPRSDIYINLPALKKLDAFLLLQRDKILVCGARKHVGKFKIGVISKNSSTSEKRREMLVGHSLREPRRILKKGLSLLQFLHWITE